MATGSILNEAKGFEKTLKKTIKVLNEKGYEATRIKKCPYLLKVRRRIDTPPKYGIYNALNKSMVVPVVFDEHELNI